MKYTTLYLTHGPVRGHSTDAGLDFFVPECTPIFVSDFKEKNPDVEITELGIILRPHQKVLIPSGVKIDVPIDHALIAFNKSGVASKLGLDLLASVVDHGYQGQVHLSLYNTTTENIKIPFGMKIIQFVLLPIKTPSLQWVPENEIFQELSERKDGGFGSTGI